MQMTSAGPAVATVATAMHLQPGSAQVAVCITERAPLELVVSLGSRMYKGCINAVGGLNGQQDLLC